MSEENPIEEILAKDPRFARQAYDFVQLGLRHTLDVAKAKGHVTAEQLLHGIRDFAIHQYGPLARTVLGDWGVHTTDDIGAIVFNMIDAGAMGKTDDDQPSDFAAVYSFEDAFPPEPRNVEIFRDSDDDEDDDEEDA